MSLCGKNVNHQHWSILSLGSNFNEKRKNGGNDKFLNSKNHFLFLFINISLEFFVDQHFIILKLNKNSYIYVVRKNSILTSVAKPTFSILKTEIFYLETKDKYTYKNFYLTQITRTDMFYNFDILCRKP